MRRRVLFLRLSQENRAYVESLADSEERSLNSMIDLIVSQLRRYETFQEIKDALRNSASN